MEYAEVIGVDKLKTAILQIVANSISTLLEINK